MKNNHHRLRLKVLFYALVWCVFITGAQTGPSNTLQTVISGTITDSAGPIPGVHIVVQGQQRGTFSDREGYYQITTSSGDVLVYTYLGFKTETRAVGTQTLIDIVLQEDVTTLQEVEVNAGYYTVKERERTGNISKVSAEEIGLQPISNPLAALQGRMAGVDVVQSSGLPGANFDIRIRGQNSIRSAGNDPLYIVDGVPFSSTSLGDNQASVALPGLGISPLNNINPTDIERIEILKDADATAIYGSRGANGVVLITTKKGLSGTTKVAFNLQTGLGTASNYMDLLNTSEYLAMRREAFANDGIEIPSYAFDINGTWDENRQTDWQKKLFGKTSYLTNLQGSVSGGDQLTQFLISGNYHKQTGVFPGEHSNDKISGMVNLNHKSNNEKLSIQFSTTYTANQNNLPGQGLLVPEALMLPPNAPELYNEDGTLNWENSTWNNPLRNFKSTYRSNVGTLISNTRLSYQILDNLSASSNFGYTQSHLRELRTIPSTIFNPAFGLGPEFSNAVHNSGERTSWIAEPQLHFNEKIGSTRIETLVGLTFQEQVTRQLSQYAFGFTNNNLIENVTAASDIFPLLEFDEKYRYQAVFGRININHMGKYLLNLTARRDGSSRFGPEKRFANFGAIGTAWVFSEEDFLDAAFPVLSFGKIRGSYGTSGNDQIGEYQYLDTYSFGSGQYQNRVGLFPTRLFNPDFSWESNTKWEWALELGFFNDRLLVNNSFFRNQSSSQLVGFPLPGTTGFSSINANLDATVQNTGWELEVSAALVRTRHVQWTTSLNLTLPKNKLLNFPDLEGSTYANQLVIGQPLNIVKVYKSLGVDEENGLYQFEDFNNDGSISSPDDRQAIVDLNPKYFGGFNNSLVVGKLRFEMLFQFAKQLGFDYSRGMSVPGSMNNVPRELLGRWTNENQQASIQRFSSGLNPDGTTAFQLYTQSDASISDASYVRLKNLHVAYEFSEKQKNGFGCEVFISGQNLWTLTNYFGLDPESRNNQTVPSLRIISIGTQLTF